MQGVALDGEVDALPDGLGREQRAQGLGRRAGDVQLDRGDGVARHPLDRSMLAPESAIRPAIAAIAEALSGLPMMVMCERLAAPAAVVAAPRSTSTLMPSPPRCAR